MLSIVDDDDGAERGDGDEKGRWVLRGPDDDDRDALEGGEIMNVYCMRWF